MSSFFSSVDKKHSTVDWSRAVDIKEEKKSVAKSRSPLLLGIFWYFIYAIGREIGKWERVAVPHRRPWRRWKTPATCVFHFLLIFLAGV